MAIKVLNEFLPRAEQARLGAVKVGQSLNITEQGTLDVSSYMNVMARTTNVVSEIPYELNISVEDGKFSAKTGTRYSFANSQYNLLPTDQQITADITGERYVCVDSYTNLVLTEGYDTNYSLPIAKISINNGEVVSIDELYPGFGATDDTIFVLPGVSGLIPAGRLANGGLNNQEFVYTEAKKVQVSENGTYLIGCNGTDLVLLSEDVTYDADLNGNRLNDTPVNYAICGKVVVENGKITEFVSRPTFHALDYYDLDLNYTKKEDLGQLAYKDKVSTSDIAAGGIAQSAVTGLTTALENKQDKLTWDDTPKASSSNPVKSSGIYSELTKKQDNLIAGTGIDITNNVISEVSIAYVNYGTGLYADITDLIAEKKIILCKYENRVYQYTSTYTSGSASYYYFTCVDTYSSVKYLRVDQSSTWVNGGQNIQPTITGAATTITSNNLTGNRAVISNSSGKIAVSDTTDTELSYVHGVTSSIQTQINNKVTGNAAITGATHTKITYDSKGLVTSGADLSASDIPSLTLDKITDVTATATELNVLDGITATTTELNYTDGVTSNIQTQLDNKVDITGDTMTGNLQMGTNASIYLTGIASTVANSKSRLNLGTPDNIYAYLTGNNSGAFGIYSETSGTRKGIACYPNQNFFADATTKTIDLGRSNNVWKTGYIDTLSNGTSSVALSTLIAKQDAITGAASTITSDNLTADRAVISNSSGKIAVSDTTSTELGYLSGVTSSIQTQLNNKQATISDLEDIRAGASAGSSALQASDIINNTASTATDKPLSANMGKSLQDQIDDLKSIGRFLSLWNCVTGRPTSDPEVLPYTYHTGDYFLVTTVASSGQNNYRPSGSSYTGAPSTTIETETVKVADMYYYDGSTWQLSQNSQRVVSFGDIEGSPSDNANLKNALDAKVTGNTAITGGTFTKVTVDSKGLVTSGTALSESDIPTLSVSKLSGVTADASELNILDGATVTANDLNMTAGAKSNIQTQLDKKVNQGDVIQNMNTHGRSERLWFSEIHDVLYKANERFTVTSTGFTTFNAARLFNGSFEDYSCKIEAGNTGTIVISGSSITGVYRSGYIFVSFYSSWSPHTADQVAITIENAAGNIATLMPEAWETKGSGSSAYVTVVRAQVPSLSTANAISKITIIITNSGTGDICPTEIEYFLTRPSSIDLLPVVTKFGNNRIYGNLTVNQIIKAGGTSSQFLKADGSVDSNSYVKTSDVTSTYSSTGTNPVNGTAVASALSSYQPLITSSNKLSADLLSEGSNNKLVSQAEKTSWTNKQDALTPGTNITITNNTIATSAAQVIIRRYS